MTDLLYLATTVLALVLLVLLVRFLDRAAVGSGEPQDRAPGGGR